jgi:outer membrane immunogenic protein
MKNFIFAASLLGLGATGALAADLPSRVAPAPYVAVPAYYDWTGIYGGVSAGAAFGRMNALDVTPPAGGFFTPLVPAGTAGFGFNNTSYALGLHLGGQYQWQSFVFGLEAGYQFTDLKQTIVSPYFPASDTESAKIRDLYTVVGRIGYAFDRFLVYGKAGYAGGSSTFTAIDNVAGVIYTQKGNHSGYVVGAGVEYAITNNWIAGLDYSHMELGSKSGSGPNVFFAGGIGANPEVYRVKATVDTISARLSYKFGGPAGAVVAKY